MEEKHVLKPQVIELQKKVPHQVPQTGNHSITD